jgi:putative transposase
MSVEHPSGNANRRVGKSKRRADEDVGAPRSNAPKQWYSRGYLPHRDRVGLLQSITFRLADSLPQQELHELEAELAHLSEDRRGAERRRKIEEWPDSGIGCCALRHPAVARTVQDSLLHFDGERYRLLAWCIMPSHVHVIVEPFGELWKIVQGWKSFTARWVLARNEKLRLGIPDPQHLWMRDYWDRYIRDEKHLMSVIEYIHNNDGWNWSRGQFGGGLLLGLDQLDGNARGVRLVGENPGGSGGLTVAILDADADLLGEQTRRVAECDLVSADVSGLEHAVAIVDK